MVTPMFRYRTVERSVVLKDMNRSKSMKIEKMSLDL